MICPKCATNVPEGPECARCGVVFDKLLRRAPVVDASPGAAIPARLAPARKPEIKRRRPIAGTLGLLGGLIVLSLGGAVAYQMVRANSQGSNIVRIVEQALRPQQLSTAMLTGEAVHQAIQRIALREKVDVPAERTWVRVRGESLPNGNWVRVTVKVLIPHKVAFAIDYPVYRKIEVSIPQHALPNGYTNYETPGNTEIGQAITAGHNN